MFVVTTNRKTELSNGKATTPCILTVVTGKLKRVLHMFFFVISYEFIK